MQNSSVNIDTIFLSRERVGNYLSLIVECLDNIQSGIDLEENLKKLDGIAVLISNDTDESVANQILGTVTFKDDASRLTYLDTDHKVYIEYAGQDLNYLAPVEVEIDQYISENSIDILLDEIEVYPVGSGIRRIGPFSLKNKELTMYKNTLSYIVTSILSGIKVNVDDAYRELDNLLTKGFYEKITHSLKSFKWEYENVDGKTVSQQMCLVRGELCLRLYIEGYDMVYVGYSKEGFNVINYKEIKIDNIH